MDNIDISPRIKLVIQNTHYINWYSTTDRLFSEAVASAFNENAANNTRINQDFDEVQTQKYFLCKEEIHKIHHLLRAEVNGKHSVCFLPENANLLGIAYELGIAVKPDPKKAILYYKASKYSGDLDGQYLYAAIKQQTEPENQAYLSEMLNAAEKGSVIALTHIGNSYYYGKNGLPVDKKKAYEYFENAAKKNGIEAMYSIAFGYHTGECVPKDVEIAYMYALKAKEYNFPRAYRLLAYMHEDGAFLEKDLHQAVAMYEQAIHFGDYLSLCFLGNLLGQLGQTDKKVELYHEAVKLAEENKIKSGSPFYRLAVLYDDGIGVEQNFEIAAQYYLKAVERNYQRAHKWIVPCILHIEGESRYQFLQEAYKLKCKDAAYELGMIEKRKRSSDQEQLSETAIEYFVTGAELGSMYCVSELIKNYSFIVGTGKNREDRIQAIKWFRFFFANADEDFISEYRKHNLLSTYYYAYAIELDYDPDVNLPDREFVLYYFKKSVEESPAFLGNIIHFAVNGYLFPDESCSGLTVDIFHAEELLAFAQTHLEEFLEYLKTDNPDTYPTKSAQVINNLKKGYLFFSQCYKNGKHVSKDKLKADKYRKLAEALRK